MSRSVTAICLALLAPASVAFAQNAHRVTAEDAIEAAGQAYGPHAPKPECEPSDDPDVIVVCARKQEQSQFRIRSDDRVKDDYARETMNEGDPQAPDVSGPGIFKGDPTVGSLCIPGLQKCPPPPAIIVDFSELPDTPPGSDADRIGRGLAPRGNELREGPQADSIGDDELSIEGADAPGN